MANDREQTRERKDSNSPKPINDDVKRSPNQEPDYSSVIKKSDNEQPRRDKE